MLFSPLAGQADCTRLTGDIIGSGGFSEKALKFHDGIHGPPRSAGRPKQAPQGEPVNRGRGHAESLRSLNAVQRQFWNRAVLLNFQIHAVRLQRQELGFDRSAKTAKPAN